MNFLRSRLHRLLTKLPQIIAQLPDENLEDTWKALKSFYYDIYMLRAIQESKQTLSPGDNLTREEALGLLNLSEVSGE